MQWRTFSWVWLHMTRAKLTSGLETPKISCLSAVASGRSPALGGGGSPRTWGK